MTSLWAMPRNLVLAASAGTGKTHALVGVLVHLFLSDREVEPSRVVATTFSRKAAAEIRARASTELARLAGDPASSPYFESLGLEPSRVKKRAASALVRLPDARFSTIHGFATSIVRSYAIELGIGPGIEIAAEADARTRVDRALASALETHLDRTPDAVRSLATAAGGIDRLVAQLRRVLFRLSEDGTRACDLVIPASDTERIAARAEALRSHARALLSNPRFEHEARDLLASFDERTVAAFCAVAARGKKTPEVESFAVFRESLMGLTNDEKGRRLARTFRDRDAFRVQAELVRDVLARAEDQIQLEGKTQAALGFGDVLRAARELLSTRPDVADEISTSLDAMLVDEFQDTSRVQLDILRLLWAKKSARAHGVVPPLATMREQGLLVVGDRKQSIYGFRGADVGVFAELAVGLAGRPAREALGIPAGVTWEPQHPVADFAALRHNRRSVPAILEFANAFSARRFVPSHPPPALYEVDYVPATEDLLAPDANAKADGPRTTWLRIAPEAASSNRLEEALVIAERIRTVVASGTRRHRDLAVLATTNAMLDAAAFALAQSDIPYVVSGKSFYRTREVRDLAAMLAFVLDPLDRVAMLEVLRGPWAALHDETLLGLVRDGSGLPPPWAWNEQGRPQLVHGEDLEELTSLSELVLGLSRAAGRLGPGTILREAVVARGLRDVYAAMPRGDQRVANVDKLLALADTRSDARAFHAWLDEMMEEEIAESEAATFSEDDDAVRLLTVHASKGLDFPVVFIPEINAPLPRFEKGAVRVADGVLTVRIADGDGMILEPPSFEAAANDAKRRERAERQRIAYVAATRASDEMIFVGGRSRDVPLDPGVSTLAVLETLADQPALLTVEDADVPAPRLREDLAEEQRSARADETPLRPAWKSLPIAPTALSDFAHCARRFELVHVLGLPEHARGRRADPSRFDPSALDARARGTLAHAALERVPREAFANEDAARFASTALAEAGLPVDHPEHEAIVGRVTRFLRGAYAETIATAGAEILREVAFVLAVEDEESRAVVLRGSMDLVVVWPDGSVDVVDYKSARGGDPEGHALQLDVYAVAARERFPNARRLRAGLVFLGGAASEPVWRALPSPEGVRADIAMLGGRLADARWSLSYPRVALARCEAIHCGFIGRCHPPERGTEANPDRATTT